jgi:hypothetical protein
VAVVAAIQQIAVLKTLHQYLPQVQMQPPLQRNLKRLVGSLLQCKSLDQDIQHLLFALD